MAGAAYGFAGMGPFWGGQAELLRVPFGDFNCSLREPECRRAEAARAPPVPGDYGIPIRAPLPLR